LFEVKMLHTVRHSFLFASCVATLAALCPAAALAQPAPAPQAAPVPVDEARQHFELGVAAMQAQRWPEAFAEFEASGRIRRSASVALNLGVVLREMRRFVEARVRLQEFNELATPAQHTQHDAQVQQMLTEISRRLGRVRVTEIAPPTATITLDGRRAQLNDANETVIDPGTHALRAEAAGFLAYEETLEIAESATRDVAVHLAAQPVETPHPAAAAPVDPRVAQTPVAQPEARPAYTRWWFWTAIGGAAVLGGVAAIVAVTSGAERPLPSTTTNLTISALTLRGAQ
jgi:hypothetical protein